MLDTRFDRAGDSRETESSRSDTGENTGDSRQQTEVIQRTGMVCGTPHERWFRALQMQLESSA